MAAYKFPEILRFKDQIIHPELVKHYIDQLYRSTSKIVNFVYFITDGTYTKIGVAENPDQRLKMLQCGNARPLTLLFSIPIFKPFGYRSNYALEVETFLQRGFADSHVSGEWFDLRDRINVDEWIKFWGGKKA